MEKDLHRVIELFRKSFSSSLSSEEKEELSDILHNNSLKGVYDQLQDKTFLADKFREFDEYGYQPAFDKLKKYHRRQVRSRLIAWGSSVAAVIMLIFMFIYGGENTEPVREPIAAQQIIPPGNKSAVLKLADGRIVPIGEQALEIVETGGSVVKYEEGNLVYSSGGTSSEELYNELKVPIGGECHVSLDDGTEIWLNAGSELKYPVAFTGEVRKVFLAGEAFFSVKKDSRPFIVDMESGEVTVLGTSFGIRAYEGETDYTTLISGKVMFATKDNKKVILSPGEQAVVYASGALEKRIVDTEEYVGWKDGLFVFKDKTLLEIMSTLERWYGVKVVFRDESLKELRYTGNLERYDSINTFLQLLERLKEIQYKIEEHTIVLSK